MEKLSREELLDEAIEMLKKSKGSYSFNELNLDMRRFRNKLLHAGIMPAWQVDETVYKLQDFLLDFQNTGSSGQA